MARSLWLSLAVLSLIIVAGNVNAQVLMNNSSVSISSNGEVTTTSGQTQPAPGGQAGSGQSTPGNPGTGPAGRPGDDGKDQEFELRPPPRPEHGEGGAHHGPEVGQMGNITANITAMAAAYDNSGPALKLQGKSASFKVVMNGSNPDDFMQVRFGRVQEVDPQGRPVKGHIIGALESLQASMQQGIMDFNGTNVTYAKMAIPLNATGPTFTPCPGAPTTSLNGSITITCFITSANTSFPFGFNNTLQAPANSFKFNIEAYDWPFCNSSNSLAVDVLIRTGRAEEPKARLDQRPANSSEPPEATRADLKGKRGMRARLEYPPGQVTAVQFPAYATDGPNGTQTFNIDIRPAGEEGKTGFTFVFPAAKAIYYDPVIATDTSVTPDQIGVAMNTTTTTASPSPTRSPSPAPKKSAGAGAAVGALAILVPAFMTALTGM